MLVDEAQAIELAGAQPPDPLLDRFIGRQAARPPIAVRQAVPVLPSYFRPAQHVTQPPEHESGRDLMSSGADAPEFQRICAISLLTLITTMPQIKALAAFGHGGEGWIRTSVRLRGQIYSLLPLTTRPPLQVKAGAPCGGVPEGCQRFGKRLSPARPMASRALQPDGGSRTGQAGAGEGNRTLVVSLEGFCSTIELHPPAVREAMPLRDKSRQLGRNHRGLGTTPDIRQLNRLCSQGDS
jgi:hypothetical protein